MRTTRHKQVGRKRHAAWTILGLTAGATLAYLLQQKILQANIALPLVAVYLGAVALYMWRTFWHGRRPKSLLGLLEQDAALQAERLRRLESAFVVTAIRPEAVMVPIEESAETLQSTPMTADGRSDYQYLHPSKRVRRRII